VVFVFFEQFKNICALNNTSPTNTLKNLNISTGNLSSWKKGGKPNAEILQKIATYFNVSTDYLLGNEPLTHASNDIKHDEIESALFNEIKDMDKETKKDILDYARYKKQQKLKV
jgi:transcriptional regulator with XRE-family HTH domain